MEASWRPVAHALVGKGRCVAKRSGDCRRDTQIAVKDVAHAKGEEGGSMGSGPCASDNQGQSPPGSQGPSWLGQDIQSQKQSHVDHPIAGRKKNISHEYCTIRKKGLALDKTYLVWRHGRRKGRWGCTVRLSIHSLRWREIGPRLRLLLWRQGLAMGTVEHYPVRTRASLALRISQVRVGSMCRDEGLRLG